MDPLNDNGPDEGEQMKMTRARAQNQPPDLSNPQCWETLESCPLCGSTDSRFVSEPPDWHYGNPGHFPVVECTSCHLNFLNPMPTPSYLATAYPQNYYAYGAPVAATDLRSPGLRRLIKQMLFYRPGETKDPKFAAPGRMLDIGCGSGSFLALMKVAGWEVKGVEPDARAASRGREAGLDIFGGTLTSAQFPSTYFDYIRSNHSFEHIHNPREVLKEIRRIIKTTGTLFIGVPNVNGLLAHLFGIYWWYLGAPVHTFGYNPHTLGKLLAQEGFRVSAIQYNSSYSGIIGSLQIYCNRNNGRSSEDGWIIRNSSFKLLGYWLARITDILHSGDCIEIIAHPV